MVWLFISSNQPCCWQGSFRNTPHTSSQRNSVSWWIVRTELCTSWTAAVRSHCMVIGWDDSVPLSLSPSSGDPMNVDQLLWVGAAAAAKSLQLCPTLCDPLDGSPPGSPVPGILQARTLKWVAISFSNAWKWKVKVKSLSCVRLLATSWTTAYQAPPSMGPWDFPGKRMWRGSCNGFCLDFNLSTIGFE